jgi:hypothetical protein
MEMPGVLSVPRLLSRIYARVVILAITMNAGKMATKIHDDACEAMPLCKADAWMLFRWSIGFS